MRQVWKFPLLVTTADYACDVEMPVGAQQVRFAPQYSGPLEEGPRPGIPTLWALVDPAAELETRTFRVFGTGHAIPDQARHVGSYDADPFVWHVFDVTPREADVPPTPSLPDDLRVHFVTLYRAGFRVRQPGAAWVAPNDEPLTTELMVAVAELQEYGYGAVVSA